MSKKIIVDISSRRVFCLQVCFVNWPLLILHIKFNEVWAIFGEYLIFVFYAAGIYTHVVIQRFVYILKECLTYILAQNLSVNVDQSGKRHYGETFLVLWSAPVGEEYERVHFNLAEVIPAEFIFESNCIVFDI